MSLKGSARRLEQKCCKEPRSSRDAPVGHQHSSGAQSLEIHWSHKGFLKIHPEHLHMNSKKHEFTLHLIMNHLPFPSFILFPLWVLSSTHWIQSQNSNWLKWDRISSCARRNYYNRVKIIWHLMFYVMISWYFQDCVYLWVLIEVMELLPGNIFPCRYEIISRLCVLQAGGIGGSVSIRTCSSLSIGHCNSWSLNKHDCQVCPQLFRRW